MSEKKESIIEYEDKKCVICKTVYCVTLIIGWPNIEFCLCLNCARELKDRLKKFK